MCDKMAGEFDRLTGAEKITAKFRDALACTRNTRTFINCDNKQSKTTPNTRTITQATSLMSFNYHSVSKKLIYVRRDEVAKRIKMALKYF